MVIKKRSGRVKQGLIYMRSGVAWDHCCKTHLYQFVAGSSRLRLKGKWLILLDDSVFSRIFIPRTCVRFHEWLSWRLRISPCNSSSHTFHSNEISEAKVLFALIKNHHILAIFQIPICFMETAQPVSVYTVFRRLVRCVCARPVSEPAGRSVSWRQWKPWTFKEYSS